MMGQQHMQMTPTTLIKMKKKLSENSCRKKLYSENALKHHLLLHLQFLDSAKRKS
jgi:hypothetical protein